MKLSNYIAATALIGTIGTAQAALYDRGGGMIYDDVLNITWLQDANYAKTSGYDADGRLNWADANTWANQLVYGGYDDWRLAANTPVGTDWNYAYSHNGTTDMAYNITSPNSELAYMYYANLGLKGQISPTSYNTIQPDFGIFGNSTCQDTDSSSSGQKDIGIFKNVQCFAYWSGTTYAPNPTEYAWLFDTLFGSQGPYGQSNEVNAWAVRDGDVATVSAPPALLLMFTGLGLLGLTRRFRKAS